MLNNKKRGDGHSTMTLLRVLEEEETNDNQRTPQPTIGGSGNDEYNRRRTGVMASPHSGVSSNSVSEYVQKDSSTDIRAQPTSELNRQPTPTVTPDTARPYVAGVPAALNDALIFS
ncbi:hypothetical protein EVAR_14052_1 [Eumeta japonica]|uniref:Uncharacterized protein n=1 Tax=Eumeta variegata TaxID=151549 RepID=A0A4C1UPU2_EUMVA|nr:hypothetical protein EVAR_14052_1 [Eumeta japonica]